MVDNYVISSLDELVEEDIVEINGFGSRVFVVSQITSLDELRIDVGFSCLYAPDFDENKMNLDVFHLNDLYGDKIIVFNAKDYAGWKYKHLVRDIHYLPV